MLTVTDPCRLPIVTRPATMDDVRGAIARRCDGLVARQRRSYSAARAAVIADLRISFDALTRSVHGAAR